MDYVIFWMISFTEYHVFEVHLGFSMYEDFIPYTAK